MTLGGCWPGGLPQWDLEQMDDQHKYGPYEQDAFFRDRMSMRTPPAGTVPRGTVVDQPALSDGRVDGNDVDHIPIPVDLELLETGRFYFENLCAACHGVLGDGNSVVAEKMRLRLPPSLVTPELQRLAPGRIFQVISRGYGLMPGFAYRLESRERWALVGYLQALQLSHGTALERLPAESRRRARQALQ